ncbi:flagellar basal body-associated FliL family protein [Myxococcota bacterium]|nr:flagellar basal body-associated FliL family protein [Myxococcota bacterium]
MAEEKAAAPATPAAPKAKPPILTLLTLVLVLVNIGATGFTAFLVMSIPAAGAPAKEEHHAEEGPGPTVALDPFIVNLNESESSRYLKTSVELEVATQPDADFVTKSKSAVRDEALRYLSSLRVADTLGEEGKNKIREELTARIEKVLGPGKLKKIYFGEFVVQ